MILLPDATTSSLLFGSLFAVALIACLAFIVAPLILATTASCLFWRRRKVAVKNNNVIKMAALNSALYTGNVWHTRFHPKRHAFTYPIFMFSLDLEELDIFHEILWPLSWLVNFREKDHLKNGEGITKSDQGKCDLAQRIMRLVADKTNNKFMPTLQTHHVMILTHLCYYGYNFNPVSFYYIIEKKSGERNKLDAKNNENKNRNDIAAIVGEVSNTPWLEQYCYVLHPDSVDRVETKIQQSQAQKKYYEYFFRFPKEFHVSPFMEMNYFYDWSFIGIPRAAATTQACVSPGSHDDNKEPSKNPITVVNSLRRRSNDRMEFTAKLVMQCNPVTPFQVAWQIIRFPIYCIIIQIWIHYQAVLLFLKGIVYIPHPMGIETTASVVIAKIMIPFFAMKDYYGNPKSKIA